MILRQSWTPYLKVYLSGMHYFDYDEGELSLMTFINKNMEGGHWQWSKKNIQKSWKM